METIWGHFVIFSSKLDIEIKYVLQILRVSPIAQLVAHQNTVIKAFIIVCTKYDSSIFKILDVKVKYVFTSSNFYVVTLFFLVRFNCLSNQIQLVDSFFKNRTCKLILIPCGLESSSLLPSGITRQQGLNYVLSPDKIPNEEFIVATMVAALELIKKDPNHDPKP